MTDPTLAALTEALLTAMRDVWPSHTEGSGGTGNAPWTEWRVVDGALPSDGLAAAILAHPAMADLARKAAIGEAVTALPEGTLVAMAQIDGEWRVVVHGSDLARKAAAWDALRDVNRYLGAWLEADDRRLLRDPAAIAAALEQGQK